MTNRLLHAGWRILAVLTIIAACLCAGGNAWAAITPPAAPTLLSPANGATGIKSPITLTWNAVASAYGYVVMVSPDTAFNTATSQTYSAKYPGVQLPELKAGATYYWRARTIGNPPVSTVTQKSEPPTSAWSSVWSFTTYQQAPPPPLNTPILALPANNATKVTRPVNLSWNAVTSATVYYIQVSSDTAFNTATALQLVQSTTAVKVDGLRANITYFWRVRAVGYSTLSAGAASQSPWSAVWSFTTAAETPPAPPAIPTLASPVNGATGLINPVTLAWNASASAAGYLVMVSPDSAFSTANTLTLSYTTSATKLPLPQLKAGATYYWRVRAIGSSTVASLMSNWSTVWAFTIAPEIQLTAPTLISPTNGSYGVIQPITLAWNSVANGYGYIVQVSVDTAFSTAIAKTFTTKETKLVTPPLRYGTLHYWRVCAVKTTGQQGPWSSTWTFTTFKPAAPTLISPTNGATGLTNPITLSWNPVSGAYASAYCYQIQVSPDTAFNTGTTSLLYTSATKIALPVMKAGTTFHWRVCVVAGSPEGMAIGAIMSDWSSVWSFTTAQETPLTAPTLVSPINGATGVKDPVTLIWNTVSTAYGYLAQLSTDSAFSTATTMAFTSKSPGAQLPALKAGTKYYWRACAVKTSGVMGPWSATWSFTAYQQAPPPPLSTPILVSPANGATNVIRPVSLSWNAVASATIYYIQVSPDTAFNTATSLQLVQSTTSVKVDGLRANTTYYWRVRAIGYSTLSPGAASQSPWSAVWSFTIAAETPPKPPVIPTLVSPTNGTTGLANPVTLTWNASASAVGYLVAVSTDTAFSTANVLTFTTSATKQALPQLKAGTVYYWRVRAIGSTAISTIMSDWSTVWAFTIAVVSPPKPPAIPALISPANMANGIARPVNLTWNAVASAACYLVQVSTANSFTASANTLQFYPTTAQQGLSQLSASTTYYWRVKTVATSALMSDWSAVWSFTTAGTTPTPTLAAPILISPSSGSTNVAQPVTLTWQAVTNATSYTVQYATDYAFTSPSIFTGVAKTSYQLKSIPVNLYYWRVKAIGTINGVAAESSWSYSWGFIPAKPF